MCIPLAAVAMAGQAAGAAGSVVGAFYGAQTQNLQTQAQKIAYGAAADTARSNAAMSTANAAQTLAVGDLNSTMATKTGAINATLLTGIGDANASLTEQIGSLNASVQEGSAKLIRQQGDFNATVDERNAQDTLRQGQHDEQSSMLASAQIKSAQRASMAANGIALDGDSAVRVLTSTDYMGAMDVDTIHANAVRTAMGYRVQGVTDRATAEFAALGAEGEALATRTNAAASALNTRTTAAMNALNVKVNATFAALNYKQTSEASALQSKMQAGNFLNEANNNDIASNGLYEKSPLVAVAGSLITSGAALADKWKTYKKAGA